MAQYPEQRHRIERRVQGERRRWLDRRVSERRVERLGVATERRLGPDRRGRERRGPVARRQDGDRRGSGLSFSDATPLTVI
ncbi:MAG: hypothetical protein AUH07_03570 [Gemmatimonadetes bacterium 13_2_20CM_70_9]|nr:MAG: hypothetical protein AUH07_03570 [Gemmatimonadetes bacterium 13_2_20CM_70_9]